MKTEEIILIAEFMGGEFENNPFFGPGFRFSGDDVDNPTWGSRVLFIGMQSFGYDSSWNHLIPVCAKIKYTLIPEGEDQTCFYNGIFNSLIDFFQLGVTFNEVVFFLMEYNKCKGIINGRLIEAKNPGV